MKLLEGMRSLVKFSGGCDKGGFVLVLTLFTLFFVSVLVAAFLDITTVDSQIASNHLHELQALYMADAGIEDAICQLRQNPSWTAGFVNKEFPVGSGNSYSVVVSISSGGTRILTSRGRVGSFERGVKAEVKVWGSTVRIRSWREL